MNTKLCFTAIAAFVVCLASAQPDRTQALHGCYGTYDAAPRRKDRRVDSPRLVRELAELRVNTYNWLIHAAPTDWDDLKLFLPQAREKGIRVWVSLVPPSESPPNNKAYAEPFRLDYERWAAEIAKLSLSEPNLVAWSIDDFTHNLRFYTPEKMRGIVGEARKINPRLAFVPCCYLPGIKPKFISDYRDSLDGILFPYRHESAKINLTDADLVAAEVQKIRAMAGTSLPVIVDVYATAHSTLGATTPDYVRQVMSDARKSADGVLVYCHQNPAAQAEKYRLIKELFHSWAESKSSKAAPSSTAGISNGAEFNDPTGLRYDTTKTFAVELPAGAPMGEASIREHAIAWHPARRKYYLVADVVPLNNPHHPNTYDTELHLWSSLNLATWTYLGVAVPKGIPEKTYDGYGTCSPAAMTWFDGKLYVAFSAAKTRTYTGRSIGLAWSGDDPERLPWTKTPQAISDLPGEDNDSGLVAIPGDDRLHLYHRTTGDYRIVHTASRTPEDPGSWPPATDVTQRPEGVRAQELTGAVWADGAVHLFIIEHFYEGPIRIAHVQSRNPGAMFEPVDPRRRYVEPQPGHPAYGGHITPVVRDERFVAFFWTVFQSEKRYGLRGHPTPGNSISRPQAP